MRQELGRSVRTLAVTEIALRLKGLLLLPVLTKHFGAVNYGVWAQVTVIVTMLGPLLTFGLDSAVMRFLPSRDRRAISEGFSSVTVAILGAALPVALMLWFAARPIATTFFESANAWPYVALCGPMLVVGLLVNQCRNFFRVSGSATGYASMAIIQAAASTIIAVAVTVANGSVWDVLVWTLYTDIALFLVAATILLRRHGVVRPSWPVLRTFLAFGLPIVPGGYATWALNSSDRLFLGHYGSLADIGVYSVVYTLGYTVMMVVFNPLWLMYQPAAAVAHASEDREAPAHLFRWLTSVAAAALVPAVVGLSIVSAPIIRLVASAEFTRGAVIVPVVTAAYALHMLASLYEVQIGLADHPGQSIAGVCVGVVVNIGLNFIAIPKFGIVGAAGTTFIGFGIQCAISAAIARRYQRMSYDGPMLLRVVVASGVMGIAVFLVARSGETDAALTAIGVGVAVYALAMYALGAFSRLRLGELTGPTPGPW